jgi:hypothetical protein
MVGAENLQSGERALGAGRRALRGHRLRTHGRRGSSICRRGAALSQPQDEPGHEHGRREDAERNPAPLRAARLLVLVGRGGRSGCCRSRRAHARGGRRGGRGGSRWRRRNGGRLRLNLGLCLRDGDRSGRSGLRNRRRGLRRRDRHGAWPGHGLRLGRRRLGRLDRGRGCRRRYGRDRARWDGRRRPRGRPRPHRRVIAAPPHEDSARPPNAIRIPAAASLTGRALCHAPLAPRYTLAIIP